MTDAEINAQLLIESSDSGHTFYVGLRGRQFCRVSVVDGGFEVTDLDSGRSTRVRTAEELEPVLLVLARATLT